MKDETRIHITMLTCLTLVVITVLLVLTYSVEAKRETIVKLVLAGATPAEARDALR